MSKLFPTRSHPRMLLLGLLLVAFALLMAYLFRTEKHDNPSLGWIEYSYRWGRAFEERADTNRDGKIDFRARFSGSSSRIGAHDYPTEFWEDRDFDGNFEIHAQMNGPDFIRIGHDHDSDGIYEQSYEGDEATRFYRELVEGSEDEE